MTEPITDGERWIYSKLSASAELAALVGTRIYPDQAVPSGTAFPYVTYFFRGAPVSTVTADISPVATRGSYLVLGVHKTGSYGGALEAIDGAVFRALHKSSGPLPNGAYVYSCSRFGLPFRDRQIIAGEAVLRLGHEYRQVIKDNV